MKLNGFSSLSHWYFLGCPCFSLPFLLHSKDKLENGALGNCPWKIEGALDLVEVLQLEGGGCMEGGGLRRMDGAPRRREVKGKF